MPPARSPVNNIRPLTGKAQAQRQASLSPRQFLAQEEANARKSAQRKARAAADVRRARNSIVPFPGGRIRQEQAFMRDARRWFAFEAARNIADSRGTGAKAKVARDLLRMAGPDAREAGMAVIRARAQRAAAAAARGSAAARRAGEIYDRQLAPVIPRGKGRGRNTIVPGPRNTAGPPPKPPKPKKPRKPRTPKRG